MVEKLIQQTTLGALLLACLSTAVASEVKEAKSFIGVGVTDGTKYQSPLEFEPIFRLGAIFDDKHRIAANYSHGFTSGVTSIHFAYDYLYPFTDSGNWQVFAGGSLGYKFGLHDKNDWTFGGQTGIRYQYSPATSIDFGYRVFDTLDDWKVICPNKIGHQVKRHSSVQIRRGLDTQEHCAFLFGCNQPQYIQIPFAASFLWS